MSVNTAHANNGVLIHANEYILLHSDCVSMDFSGQDNPLFKGTKGGRIYLTSHRMIFNSKKSDAMMSFSAPFIALSDVELEQPVFGANYIKGKVRAQPNGNFVGEVKFKLYFKAGGAIEYGQALLRAARTAQRNFHSNGPVSDDPPPYTPAGAWHEAPPPAYQPPYGYYGWLPTHDAFTGPAPNTVFVSDNPPPYPGIDSPQQPQQPQQQQNWNGYQPPQYNAPGFQAPGFQPPGYNAVYGNGPAPYGGPPQQSPYGYPPQQAPYGNPSQQPPYGGQPMGYGGPPAAGGYAYPPGGPAGGAAAGAMGFSSAPPPNSKEAEAMASATQYNWHNSNPGSNELPPAYNDLPPNYGNAARRNN